MPFALPGQGIGKRHAYRTVLAADQQIDMGNLVSFSGQRFSDEHRHGRISSSKKGYGPDNSVVFPATGLNPLFAKPAQFRPLWVECKGPKQERRRMGGLASGG